MKIAKDQIHEELRSSVFKLKPLEYLTSREWGYRLLNFTFSALKGKKTKGLQNEERYIKSTNGGPDIRIRIYKPLNMTEPLPVMLYLHGGGYAMGCPEQADSVFKEFIRKRPCIIVAPGYRNSLQEPYPAAFDDCYDTLLWVKDNAETLNAIEDKIIVAGHSAGGGLTAAVTLKARDTQDAKIAFQMPIYPMIEDRHQNESSAYLSPVWSARSNILGWECYLRGLVSQNADIPAYAAPARNEDYSNFPPTITFVGSMEPFRDETIQYVDALKKANIPCEFELYDGCFHGFEIVASKAPISQAAQKFMYDSYVKYYDQYVVG